eukprot:gene3987-2842_t
MFGRRMFSSSSIPRAMYSRLHINSAAQAQRLVPSLIPIIGSIERSNPMNRLISPIGEDVSKALSDLTGKEDVVLRSLLESVAPSQMQFLKLLELWGIGRPLRVMAGNWTNRRMRTHFTSHTHTYQVMLGCFGIIIERKRHTHIPHQECTKIIALFASTVAEHISAGCTEIRKWCSESPKDNGKRTFLQLLYMNAVVKQDEDPLEQAVVENRSRAEKPALCWSFLEATYYCAEIHLIIMCMLLSIVVAFGAGRYYRRNSLLFITTFCNSFFLLTSHTTRPAPSNPQRIPALSPARLVCLIPARVSVLTFRPGSTMPDPYKGNEQAASLVDYYASDRMLRDSVYRLHNQAIYQKRATIRRAETQFYPPSPRLLRSQEEMDRYLERRVTKEMLRRQQRRAETERELYPERFRRIHISEEALEEQLQRLYTPATPEHRIKRKPPRHRDPVTGKPLPSPKELAAKEDDEGSEEGGEGKSHRVHRLPPRDVWRPTYCHGEVRASVLEKLYSPPPREPAPFDKSKHEERILALSKPLRVTPRPQTSETAENPKPPFKVLRKVKHEDEFLGAHEGMRGNSHLQQRDIFSFCFANGPVLAWALPFAEINLHKNNSPNLAGRADVGSTSARCCAGPTVSIQRASQPAAKDHCLFDEKLFRQLELQVN